ncbi:PhzF family phenazine biosynthesis protein, partial [Vibrio parahaemolyticus]|uniref:PhzF family phenazine biosynthesis protein n=1 Tax=Vibrio parahaemolyticus TaxID=670 RepID=UPI0005C257EF
LTEGLNCEITNVLLSLQAYFVIVEDEQPVCDVQYRSDQLKQLAAYDIVVTSKGSQCDFVSRYLWPANGGDEDPVTGSIHAGLAPYWALELGIASLGAYQASARGGVLCCEGKEDCVNVSGDGELYMKGKI